jgi:hypothetical protein
MKTTSVAQPILVALGRAAQTAGARADEALKPAHMTEMQRNAHDRAMEEPERWDGMA